MKNVVVVTVFFLVIFNPLVQSQDCCAWSETFNQITCGLRQPGDQLLFNDLRSSNWTIGIDNRFSIDYRSIYVTWWQADLSANWSYFSRSVGYNYFSIGAGSFNSTLFTMNVTAYGQPTAVEVPFGCLLQNDKEREEHVITHYNPKYQLD